MKQLDERLIYWPKFLTHKCKQRLTRLVQVQIRSRRIALQEQRLGEKVVSTLAPKVKRREMTRERKALAAAKLERTIEKELIEKLKSGVYGEQPLNVDEKIWEKVLKGLEAGGEVEEDEEEEEDEEKEDGDVEYVTDEELDAEELADLEDWLGSEDEDMADDSEEEESDSEDDAGKRGAGAKRKKGDKKKPAKKCKSTPTLNLCFFTNILPAKAHVEVEYEEEPQKVAQMSYAF